MALNIEDSEGYDNNECEKIAFAEIMAFEHKNYAPENSVFTWTYAGPNGMTGSINPTDLN